MLADTTAANRRMDRFDSHDCVWLFGYGSLIWKVDFDYLQRRPAHIHGWARRFWQGSHDHRGTAQAPGRVATLIREPGATCAGMAFLITPATFAHLDHREKNGYLRIATRLSFETGGEAEGVVYMAREDNPAYLGAAPAAQIARHIADASGPSGSNREYLLRLAQALRELDVHDPHVAEIERQLLALDPAPDSRSDADATTQVEPSDGRSVRPCSSA